MSVSGRWRQVLCGIVVAALVAGCTPSDPPAEAEPLQYQPVDDLCALDLSELFAAPAREPSGHRYVFGAGDDTSLTCTIDFRDRSVEPGEGGHLVISVRVLPQHDPDDAFSFTAAQLYATAQRLREVQDPQRYQELAGLGSMAEWSTDGKDVYLSGYDGNLLFDLRWTHDRRASLSPPDLLQRLVHVAGLILTQLRIPGLPAPAVLPASSAPLISAPTVSGGYHAVENLCEVVDVSSLGTAAAPSPSASYGSADITMTCWLQIRTASTIGSLRITARVFDGPADNAYAAYLTTLPGQPPADQPFVQGAGSHYTIDAAEHSYLVAHHLNLVIHIRYMAPSPPGEVGDELAAVANSLLTGLQDS